MSGLLLAAPSGRFPIAVSGRAARSDVAVNNQCRSHLAVDVFRQLMSIGQCVEVEERPFPYGAVLGNGLPYGSVLSNGLRCEGRIILRPVDDPHVDSDAALAGLCDPVAGASKGT